jgi:ATP-dependent DNA ligase
MASTSTTRDTSLQATLSAGRDGTLFLQLFDLLHLDGWDLRECTLLERKRVLSGISDWRGMLRYSDHQLGNAADMLREALLRSAREAALRRRRGHRVLRR